MSQSKQLNEQQDSPRNRGEENNINVRLHPMLTIFIWAVIVVVLLYFWTTITTLLALFLAAAVTAAALRPLADRLPGSRPYAGAITWFVFIAVLAGGIFLTVSLLAEPFRSEVEQWPEIKETLNESLATWSEKFGIEEELTVGAIFQSAREWLTRAQNGETLGKLVNAVTALIIAIALWLFGTLYLLTQPSDVVRKPLNTLVPQKYQDRYNATMLDLAPRLRMWMLGTLISMTIIGVVSGLAFTAIGLKFALVLALIAGLAEIVPVLGPTIAFIFAVMVASTQSTAMVLTVSAVYLGIQTIESYLLVPIVMRKAINIPPIITVFSIVLWTRLIGPLGLLLALPINLTIWSILQHFVRPRIEERKVKELEDHEGELESEPSFTAFAATKKVPQPQEG